MYMALFEDLHGQRRHLGQLFEHSRFQSAFAEPASLAKKLLFVFSSMYACTLAIDLQQCSCSVHVNDDNHYFLMCSYITCGLDPLGIRGGSGYA